MPCVCLWVEDRWVVSLLNLMDSLCPIADYRDDMFDITERVELVSQFFMLNSEHSEQSQKSFSSIFLKYFFLGGHSKITVIFMYNDPQNPFHESDTLKNILHKTWYLFPKSCCHCENLL